MLIEQIIEFESKVPGPLVVHIFLKLVIFMTSDVVKTLMVETETKTKTWKKFETKTRDQDLKKFSRPRSRLGEFV